MIRLSSVSLLSYRPQWHSGLGVRLQDGRSGVHTPAESHLRLENWQSSIFPVKTPGTIGTLQELVGSLLVYCDSVGRSLCPLLLSLCGST